MGSKSSLTAIVAIDRQGAIGSRGKLLCHLPDDLKRFKQLTTGHSIIMGRKTFQSFPKGALPNRQNIVITRDETFDAQNVTVVHSLSQAIDTAVLPGEVFIIGGAQVYQQSFDMVDKIYLTVIDNFFDDCDAFFPMISPNEWEIVADEYHAADDRHAYPFSFLTLVRR